MAKDWRVERAGDEEHRSDERWLITYADMITVLLIFFITMFAVSSRLPNESLEKLAKSLNNSLVKNNKDKVVTPFNKDTDLATGSIPRSVRRAMAPYKANSMVKVDETSDGTIISLADNSFFDLGSTTLKDSGKQALLAIAKVIATSSEEISIEGHTDSVRANANSGVANWIIAAGRAAAVVNYMSIVGKVPAKRFQVVSYGEYNPKYMNNTAAHRAMNRRVDIVIHDHPPLPALTPGPTVSPEPLPPAFTPDANGLPKPPAFNQPGSSGGGVPNPFGNSF